MKMHLTHRRAHLPLDPSDARIVAIEDYRKSCLRALLRQAKASEWPKDCVQFLERQVHVHASALRKIVRLRQSGQGCEADRKSRVVLRSFSCRLCGLLDQFVLHKGAAEPLERLEWEKLESLIKTSPLTGADPDPCRIFYTTKANGEPRIITSPGLKTRAAQRSLAVVLLANGIGNPFEYNCKGKGGIAALNKIRNAIIEDELCWFVVFDLANYFTSVKPQHLNGFSIPKEVKRSVVFHNQHATLTQMHKPLTSLSIGGKCHPARRGIPQGAVTSGILASALLGRELRHLSEDLGIVTYVDDGVIGARSQPEAEEAARALEKRFAKLNGGPIHFKYVMVRDASKGFAFLGYWVQRIETDSGIRVRFTPSHQSKVRFQRELHKRLQKKGPDLTWDEGLDLMRDYRRHWVAQKALWMPSESEWRDFEDETMIWVDDFFNGCTQKFPLPS